MAKQIFGGRDVGVPTTTWVNRRVGQMLIEAFGTPEQAIRRTRNSSGRQGSAWNCKPGMELRCKNTTTQLLCSSPEPATNSHVFGTWNLGAPRYPSRSASSLILRENRSSDFVNSQALFWPWKPLLAWPRIISWQMHGDVRCLCAILAGAQLENACLVLVALSLNHLPAPR